MMWFFPSSYFISSGGLFSAFLSLAWSSLLVWSQLLRISPIHVPCYVGVTSQRTFLAIAMKLEFNLDMPVSFSSCHKIFYACWSWVWFRCNYFSSVIWLLFFQILLWSPQLDCLLHFSYNACLVHYGYCCVLHPDWHSRHVFSWPECISAFSNWVSSPHLMIFLLY